MITNKLIVEIKSKINDNQKQGITGGILQGVLLDMVESLSEAYPQIYTDEQKAQARANIDALSDYDGVITKEKLSTEVQAILDDVANKQNITDESLATIAKTIVGAINEVYKGGLEDASIATSKIEDGAITEPKLDTDLVNVITSAVQPTELASAIATALASYVAKTDIVDTTGSATDKVISQHGVTEAINGVNNKVTELQTEINSKQDALTLTVKDNGNIVLAYIQGQSKEFMPATPSGDPMHYAYIAAGAEYNENTGFWKIGSVDDITNDEIRGAYNIRPAFVDSNFNGVYSHIRSRVIFPMRIYGGGNAFNNKVVLFYDSPNLIEIPETFNKNLFYYSGEATLLFKYDSKLKYIRMTMVFEKVTNSQNSFAGCISLEEVLIQTNSSLYFNDCSKLSTDSVLYMINKEFATSPITITLHADVYNRCMANADILAALQAHTNISLASA